MIFECSNDINEIKEAYLKGLESFNPLYFVTITFKKSNTDRSYISKINRLLRRMIVRSLFGKRKSNLKFLFTIERHSLEHNKKPKYHIHFLVGINKGDCLEISKEDLKIAIFKECKKIKYESMVDFYYRELLNVDVQESDEKHLKQFSYVLKEFESSCDALDIENSDFKFS